jgi:hypothetical protein
VGKSSAKISRSRGSIGLLESKLEADIVVSFLLAALHAKREALDGPIRLPPLKTSNPLSF